MRVVRAALLIAFIPTAVAAQPSPVARFDVTPMAGAFATSERDDDAWDDWAESWLAEIHAGIYWTDHLKTELAIGATTDGTTRGVQEIIPVTGRAQFRQIYRHVLISASQSYQFGRNALFHPFLAAGLVVDRERHTFDRPGQNLYVSYGPPSRTVWVPPVLQTSTRWQAVPFVAGGFKGYLSERAFFRTDLQFGLKSAGGHVAWKAGFGSDF
jgi:hypothetical protein